MGLLQFLNKTKGGLWLAFFIFLVKNMHDFSEEELKIKTILLEQTIDQVKENILQMRNLIDFHAEQISALRQSTQDGIRDIKANIEKIKNITIGAGATLVIVLITFLFGIKEAITFIIKHL